jgi:hypothetical protein
VCLDTKPLLPAVPIDGNLGSINWVVDDLIYVWNEVLQVFSGINTIKDPAIHEAAMRVLCYIIEILQQAEEAIPYQSGLESEHKPLCLVNIFGHWLFEASFLPE